jgi:hypothetical protein
MVFVTATIAAHVQYRNLTTEPFTLSPSEIGCWDLVTANFKITSGLTLEPALGQVKGENMSKNTSSNQIASGQIPDPRLRLLAILEDIDTGLNYCEIAFNNTEGARKKIVAKRAVLSDRRQLLTTLLDAGADLHPSTTVSAPLLDALISAQPKNHRKVTATTGFRDDVYVTPHGSFGGSSPIEFHSTEVSSDELPFGLAKGSLKKYLKAVKPIVKRSRIVRLQCCGQYASILAGRIDVGEIGIIHLNGTSGCGKTVSNRITMSISGRADRNDVEGFAGSVAGIEQYFARNRNQLTVLDDLPTEGAGDLLLYTKVERLTYAFTNTKGRKLSRHNSVNDQGSRPTWAQFGTTNAEFSIRDLASRAGRQIPEGVLRRIIDVYAGDAQSTTICDIGRKPGDERFKEDLDLIQRTADALKDQYGTALPVFVKWIIAQKALQEQFEVCRDEFHRRFDKKYLGELTSWQTAIVAKFSSLCAAGCLAIRAGVMPCGEGSLTASIVLLCVDAIGRDQVGGNILPGILGKLAAQSNDPDVVPVHQKGDDVAFDLHACFGFRRRDNSNRDVFFVLPDKLKALCGSAQAMRRFLQHCLQLKILVPGTAKLTQPVDLPGNGGSKRCYRFDTLKLLACAKSTQ